MKKFWAIKTVWTNAELGMLKFCWISFGMCLGIMILPLLEKHFRFVLFFFVISALISLVLWISKIRQEVKISKKVMI